MASHFEYGTVGSKTAMGGLAEGVPSNVLHLDTGCLTVYDFTTPMTGTGVITAQFAVNDIGTNASEGVGNPLVAIADAPNGTLVITVGTDDDTGIQIEGITAHIVPTTGKDFAYGVRFKKNVAAKGAMFLGLAVGTTTVDAIHATNGTLDYTNAIGFWTGENAASGATLSLQARRSSGSGTGSATIGTLADNTYVDVGFRAKVVTITSDTLNGTVQGYLRNATTGVWARAGSVISGAIPNDGLQWAMAGKNDAAAATEDTIITIDHMWTWAPRNTA